MNTTPWIDYASEVENFRSIAVFVEKGCNESLKNEDNNKDDVSKKDETSEEHSIYEIDCNENDKDLTEKEVKDDENNKKIALKNIFFPKLENQKSNSEDEKQEEDNKDVNDKPSTSNDLYENRTTTSNWIWEGASRNLEKEGLVYQYYKKARRGNICLKVGDIVRIAAKPEEDYHVAKIRQMWEVEGDSEMKIQTQWFYREKEAGCKELEYPGAVFISEYTDDNSIDSVDEICEVLSLPAYKERFGNDIEAMEENCNCFYKAGKINNQNFVEIDSRIPFAKP